MKEQNSFIKGIIDGLPICFGYLSVAFAFGIFSVESGLSALEAILISMTNVTSAGQLAAVPIIAGTGGFIELAVAQFIINIRYALMSVSLSQKIGKSVRMIDRFIIAFVNTDEVFGVASGQKSAVGRNYLYGLILTPYLGWSTGTAIGVLAGNMLPQSIISALGIAIYGMFIAIVVPPAKKEKSIAAVSLFAILLGCLFKVVPFMAKVPQGFVIIISAVVSSLVLAYLAPIKREDEEVAQ